ncbi:hypothetical protein QVD99_001223 [Batrachochytrium dendrobatidis]|nr:hypothetical protein O5D80_000982 [Batrachochytrium dendrobatidis]KAK5672461.1 hypothetical protein QVD99_001223 [Batrachochytrium dendrobatidis]
MNQPLQGLFSQSGSLDNALSNLDVALSTIPLNDQRALLPALYQLKKRLLDNQSDHNQYVQWAIQTLISRTIQLPGDVSITDIMELNMRNPAVRTLAEMVVFCLEPESGRANADLIFSTIFTHGRIHSSNSMSFQSLWIVMFVISALPYSMILPFHVALNHHYATVGNTTLTAISSNMFQKNSDFSPLSLFTVQCLDSIAVLYPNILAGALREMIDIYTRDVVQAATFTDHSMSSRHILAYLFTICILSPATWKVCEKVLLNFVLYDIFTGPILIESNIGFSIFTLTHLQQIEYVPLRPIVNDLITILFRSTLENHSTTLRCFVKLSNWCTSVENDIDDGAANEVRQKANLTLLQDLERTFSILYCMVQESWILQAPFLQHDDSSAYVDMANNTNSHFYSSKEYMAILLCMKLNQSSNIRQGLLVKLVGLHLDQHALVEFLSQDSFCWWMNDQVVFLFAQVYPKLQKHMLKHALSLAKNSDSQSINMDTIMTLLDKKLQQQNGLVIFRQLFSSSNIAKQALKVKHTDVLTKSKMNAVKIPNASSLGFNNYLQTLAILLGLESGLEPAVSFKLGMFKFNQITQLQDSQEALIVREAQMNLVVDIYGFREFIPALFQRLLRGCLFSKHKPYHIGFVSDSRPNPSTLYPHLLMLCSLHLINNVQMIDCLCIEIARTKEDPLKLFIDLPWLWNLTNGLVTNSMDTSARGKLVHLFSIMTISIRRFWSLRVTQLTSQHPLQLECTKNLLELLMRLYPQLTTCHTSVLWNTARLLDHLDAKQTICFLDIWVDISRVLATKAASELLEDNVLRGWICQMSALWKSASLYSDDPWLLAMTSTILRTSTT